MQLRLKINKKGKAVGDFRNVLFCVPEHPYCSYVFVGEEEWIENYSLKFAYRDVFGDELP